MQKRILHVYNVMNRGGAETFVMNIFNNLDKKEYTFDFLCTSSKSGSFDNDIILNGGRIFRFQNFSSKKILSNIIYTYKILKTYGPYNAIHIPMQFYSWVFCVAARIAGVKRIIVHSHSAGHYNNKIFRKIYMKLSRFLINLLSTDRIACGEKAGIYLFGDKAKFDILFNGIELKKFGNINTKQKEYLKKKYNLENIDFVIGHVGNFLLVKNHIYFIKLANVMKENQINFKIVLIGDGNEKKKIEIAVKKNNLDDYFVFTGAVKNVNELYSVMDVFVMPSLFEGFPVSIIEAIASGLPCFLSDNITKEVDIVTGECKFFNLNDSIIDVYNAILKMKAKTFDVKKNHLKLIEMGFDIDSVTNKVLSYYE